MRTPHPAIGAVSPATTVKIAQLSHPINMSDSESQPLLGKTPPTPLPKVQLSLLFFIRATDPICYNVIFPFINQMRYVIARRKVLEFADSQRVNRLAPR